MVIVYGGKWRWIPVHNVYWSNSNIRTATCIMTIVHSKTDKNYTKCFCSKLTPIQIKLHTQLNTKPSKALLDLHRLLITFIFSLCVSVIHCPTQFPFFPISTSIQWIKFFLSFHFWRPEFWLTSLTFVVLFRRKIIPLSLRLLCVSNFWSPKYFSLVLFLPIFVKTHRSKYQTFLAFVFRILIP
jgi:hypothetical protein